MGKRTRQYSDYDVIAKMIKKLEEKLTRVRSNSCGRTPRRSRQISSSSSSSSSSNTNSNSRSSSRSSNETPSPTPAPLCIEGVPTLRTYNVPTATSPQPSTSAAASAQPPLYSDTITTARPATPRPSTSTAPDVQLAPSELAPVMDHDLMQILGVDPSQVKIYGKDIQPDLAIRLQHIATTGLTKEARKELLEKYLPPANCTLIDAPALNPETVHAIAEPVLKRDKGIELRQKQRAAATTCIAEALTTLMSSDPKNTSLIKLLMDAVKLMCDNQATDSAIRRSFVLNSLKKDLKEQLGATKIDKFLFAEGLAETLKAAKAISKSGADMKPTPATQQPAKNKTAHNLNWCGPPPTQRPKGAQRTKEPFAPKNRHKNSLKRSSHPAHKHSRSRR